MKTYQTRQYETFGPLPDNDWVDCDEATARATLGNVGTAWTFETARADMQRGNVVTYCGLIDFRWIEKE